MQREYILQSEFLYDTGCICTNRKEKRRYKILLDSIKKNKTGIILMLLSSIFVCIGQLLWKLSAEQGIFVLLMGFASYGIGALLMLVAYRFGKLSVLQPMLSLNYVLSIILAALVLNEHISVMKGVGVFIIITGVMLIVGGDEK